MQSPTFVGYYTIGTDYEKMAEDWITMMQEWGLPHDVRGVANLGSWQKNTQYKSTFIHGLLFGDYARTPIVYLDMDAKIMRLPKALQDISSDVSIAAAKFRGHELLSGTVFFRPCLATRDVVNDWVGLCKQYPDTIPGGLLPHHPNPTQAWDQRLLDVAIRRSIHGDFKFQELPPEYTYIHDLSKNAYPNLEPVIMHHAASREQRYKIGAAQ